MTHQEQALLKDLKAIPACWQSRMKIDVTDGYIHIYGIQKSDPKCPYIAPEELRSWRRTLLWEYDIPETTVTLGHKVLDLGDRKTMVTCHRLEAAIPADIMISQGIKEGIR